MHTVFIKNFSLPRMYEHMLTNKWALNNLVVSQARVSCFYV